jgi:hypothetical protein
MGATTFSTTVKVTANETAREAFRAAVQNAQHENGHGGYTGTIAEKDDFIVISTAPSWEAAAKLADPDLPDVEDKWGPAGCIIVKQGNKVEGYVFFGWASE